LTLLLGGVPSATHNFSNSRGYLSDGTKARAAYYTKMHPSGFRGMILQPAIAG
jgi:hypothetical protein